MTEKEAIKEFKENIEMPFGISISNEASEIAIKAIKKNEQYRSIGTVEKCQEARERLKMKKPNIWVMDDNEGNIYDMYDCPNCGKSYEIDYEEYNHCPKCGQDMKIEWR